MAREEQLKALAASQRSDESEMIDFQAAIDVGNMCAAARRGSPLAVATLVAAVITLRELGWILIPPKERS